MKVQDKWTLGYIIARMHDTSVKPEDKTIHLCEEYEQSDIGRYEDLRHNGDWQGLYYWEFNPVIEDFSLVTFDDPTVPASRKQTIAGYHVGQKNKNPNPRNVGSWASVVPAIITDSTGSVKPIFSKTGGTDERYKAKKIKSVGFAQNPKSEANRDEVKSATGTAIPQGMPILVVQCLNGESYELLAYPVGNFLCLDNSPAGFGTKVGKVVDGKLESDGEVASLGSILMAIRNESNQKVVALNGILNPEDNETGHGAIITADRSGNPHLCYLSSQRGGPFVAGVNTPGEIISANGTDDYLNVQRLGIDTNTRYYKSDERDGKLAFSDVLFPTLTGESEVIEVLLGFDPVTKTWRWFVQEELAQTLFARVAWNMQVEDLSEGELLGVNTQEVEPKIWIDYEQSKSVSFLSAGTDTMFIVQLVQKAVNRNGEVRDLYRVARVESESPNKIEFVELVNRETQSYRVLKNVDQPWLDGDPVIKTLIGADQKENIIRVEIQTQWDFSNQGADFRYLKRNSDLPILRSFFAPIRPTPKDELFDENFLMRSQELLSAENPIATYAIKNNRDGIDGKFNAVTQDANMLPIFGSPDRSILLQNIDLEDTKVCKVVSYDAARGLMQAKNLFDETKIFEVACFVMGQPGLRPSPDQILVDGLVTIHRVRDLDNTNIGESSVPGQNVVDWVSLFFLSQDNTVTFDILVVDNPPLFGAEIPKETVSGAQTDNSFVALNLEKITNFVAFSSGGARVTTSDPAIFLADSLVAITPLMPEKSDCETATGRNIYAILVKKVNVSGEPAFLVIGDSSFGFSAECCEDPQEEPPPPPPPDELETVRFEGYDSVGNIIFQGNMTVQNPPIVTVSGTQQTTVFALGDPVPGGGGTRIDKQGNVNPNLFQDDIFWKANGFNNQLFGRKIGDQTTILGAYLGSGSLSPSSSAPAIVKNTKIILVVEA